MKFLKFFLIVCILFLSSYDGMAAILKMENQKICCQEKSMSGGCEQNGTTNSHSGSPKKALCNPVFSCSVCGFLIAQSYSINYLYTVHKEKVPAHSIEYIPSDYSKANWHPPKV